MFTSINPKLPMRNNTTTKAYYLSNLNFNEIANYQDYLILGKDNIEIHFFLHKKLDTKENYGQVYIRTTNIDLIYQNLLENNISIHPNAPLQIKPWGQKEFSLLDPDNNLITFGQSIEI